MNHLARMVSIVVVLVTLAVAPGASRAQGRAAPEPDAAQGAQLKALGQASAAPLRAGFDPDTGRVTTLSGRFTPAAPDRPAAARAFLAAHAALLRLRLDLGDLRLAREVDSPGGATLTFGQEHHGVPVFEGAVVVGFDRQGNIVHVQNAHVPDLTLPTAPAVSPYQAESVAESDLGASFPQGEASVRLVFVRGDKGSPGHHLAWQVSVVLDQPRGDWHVFVDARTGQVVRRLNMAKSTGSACVLCVPGPACGRVFDRSPVDAANDLGLRDSSNVDGTQVACSLENLTSASSLDGLWANTSRTQSRAAPPYDYLRSTNQRAVDEVTAYYHTNRSKAYLDSLGFTSVMGFSIALDAHNQKLGDNAQYIPSGKYIELGEGGVDDAQDPDVIYHELGHAIQDDQVPGFGTTAEAAAIGEGFGDYWAAALTDDAFTSLGKACVAAWDATTYNPYSVSTPGSGCLRRVDGTKQFPRDLAIDEHANGEIWSAALWTLRNDPDVGPTTADKLVVQSHYLLPVNATFINAADALLSADHTLNSDANATAIHAAMKAYGIPRTGASVLPNGMTAYVSASCQSSHRYQNLEYRECTLTVLGAARVRVRFSKFDTEAGYDFVYVTDADYGQVQRLSGKPFGKSGGYSAAVTGNTVVVRFRADSSIIGWGFAIDRVYYSTTP
jgi:Zn-dependent metalloprotease